MDIRRINHLLLAILEIINFHSNVDIIDLNVTNAESWLETSLYNDSYSSGGKIRLYFSSNSESNSDRKDKVVISNKKGTVLYSFKVVQKGYRL